MMRCIQTEIIVLETPLLESKRALDIKAMSIRGQLDYLGSFVSNKIRIDAFILNELIKICWEKPNVSIHIIGWSKRSLIE